MLQISFTCSLVLQSWELLYSYLLTWLFRVEEVENREGVGIQNLSPLGQLIPKWPTRLVVTRNSYTPRTVSLAYMKWVCDLSEVSHHTTISKTSTNMPSCYHSQKTGQRLNGLWRLNSPLNPRDIPCKWGTLAGWGEGNLCCHCLCCTDKGLQSPGLSIVYLSLDLEFHLKKKVWK